MPDTGQEIYVLTTIPHNPLDSLPPFKEMMTTREVAVLLGVHPSAYDAKTEGWRGMNYARMNADWYWEIASKLNQSLNETELRLGIPVATKQKWLQALESLTPEEKGRFKSFHLQEKNEAERLYDL